MNPRQKALALIELTADKSTTEEERIAAAIQAVALIRKHGLLSSPIDKFLDSEDETVRAAKTILDTINDPSIRSSAKSLIDSVKTIGKRRARRRR